MKKIFLPALGVALLLASCTQTEEKQALATVPVTLQDDTVPPKPALRDEDVNLSEEVFTPPVIAKDAEAQYVPLKDANDTKVEIIKDKGNVKMEISSKSGDAIISVEKDGVKEKIKMADWEKNKEMYEKKYGKLPPPPPPPPPAAPKPPPPPPPPPIKS